MTEQTKDRCAGIVSIGVIATFPILFVVLAEPADRHPEAAEVRYYEECEQTSELRSDVREYRGRYWYDNNWKVNCVVRQTFADRIAVRFEAKYDYVPTDEHYYFADLHYAPQSGQVSGECNIGTSKGPRTNGSRRHSRRRVIHCEIRPERLRHPCAIRAIRTQASGQRE